MNDFLGRIDDALWPWENAKYEGCYIFDRILLATFVNFQLIGAFKNV